MITEKEFIDFKQRVRNHEIGIVQELQKQLGLFKINYELEKSKIKEADRKEASDFNIFEILGFGHLEVRTHTPFLAELLNPRGSHGQGNHFLQRFFNYLNILEVRDRTDCNWRVIKESEFIDLRIVNYKLKKAVFIENKVYTDAHDGQLSRYYKKWKEGFPNGGRFIYLTISGNEPSDNGFDDSVDSRFPKKIIKDNLLCMSYKEHTNRKHIKGWIESAFPDIQAARVKETLTQYIHLIDNL